MRKYIFLTLLILLAACSEQKTADIRVVDGWVPDIPPVIKVTAALMILHNDGDKPKYLISASSPRAESIEIHRSIVVEDLAKMIRQEAVEVPAKGSVEFSSQSGYHLMLYGMKEIKEGQMIPITLTFKDGSSITNDYEVINRLKKFKQQN